MFECNFTGYILKGFLLWGFLFPTKMRYSLGYKPSEVQEASTGMLIRAVLTVISSDSRAESQGSQGCLKLPQNCSPSSPPWGSFLLKYFFIILIFFCFFHFPLPSLAWSGEHPVLGGRDLLGNRFCAWLFHQVGSSFWRQKELPGSWGGPGSAAFPWLHRVPPSVSCCMWSWTDPPTPSTSTAAPSPPPRASLQEKRGFSSALKK